jgi:hypothetical protein
MYGLGWPSAVPAARVADATDARTGSTSRDQSDARRIERPLWCLAWALLAAVVVGGLSPRQPEDGDKAPPCVRILRG